MPTPDRSEGRDRSPSPIPTRLQSRLSNFGALLCQLNHEYDQISSLVKQSGGRLTQSSSSSSGSRLTAEQKLQEKELVNSSTQCLQEETTIIQERTATSHSTVPEYPRTTPKAAVGQLAMNYDDAFKDSREHAIPSAMGHMLTQDSLFADPDDMHREMERQKESTIAWKGSLKPDIKPIHQQWFERCLQHDSAECLDPDDITQLFMRIHGDETLTKKRILASLVALDDVLTKDGEARQSSKERYGQSVLNSDHFELLLSWKDATKSLDEGTCQDLGLIRDVMIKHSADVLVAEYAHLNLPDFVYPPAKLIRLMEPFIGAMIAINTITVGVSADQEWEGWIYLEGIFAFGFLIEIIIKLIMTSPREFYLGRDWSWNWFDSVIASLALIDLWLALLSESDDRDMKVVQMARMARLGRMLRLVRLLRFKILKELELMLKGIMAGIKTLGWAIVLLMVLVYIGALTLRQTVGEDNVTFQDEYGTVLFVDMPWSMFFLFRILMGDGDLPNGTPLSGHLYMLYGGQFGVPYVLFLSFVAFGVFNVMTALFVENVMESAKQKRALSEQDECLRVAQLLRGLVLYLAGVQRQRDRPRTLSHYAQRQASRMSVTIVQSLSDTPKKGIMAGLTDGFKHDGRFINMAELTLEDTITRQMFLDCINSRDVNNILDDLEIQIADRTQLFDVLDSDGSQELQIHELVIGLMKLRSGGADKTDEVATVLGVKAILHILKDFREDVMSTFEVQAGQITAQLARQMNGVDPRSATR